MLSVFVLLALHADPASVTPVTLALPGLNTVNLNPGEGDLYTEVISQKFIEHGVKVMTARDLKSMLGLEREKALLGCAEESCVVEMTAALGADGVLVGDLGKLGNEYALNLKVLASKNGDAIALSNARALDSHDLSRVIDNSVHTILRELSVKLHRPELMANTEPMPVEPLLVEFKTLKEVRATRGRLHSLNEILVIAICGFVCGVDDWVDLEFFGNCKKEWFESFLPLANGKDNAPENMAMMRHVALNLLKQATTEKPRVSIKTKRKLAGWDHQFLAHVLGL